MEEENKYHYRPLPDPIPITEQHWPDDLQPLVTIDCRAYMHESFIRDAIEGFLMQQTTFKVEIWIHDDASTDNTANIIREYEKKHPQLFVATYQVENQYKKNPKTTKYIKPPPRRGKYIASCEGDDYWTDPLKLQKQTEFMESNPGYSLCYHSYKVQEGEQISEKTFPKRGKDFSSDGLIATPDGIVTASKFFINYSEVYGIAVPRGFGGDYFLNVFLGTLGRCKFLESVGPSIRRKHSGGVWTSKNKNAKHYGVINTKIKVYQYFQEQNDEHHMNVSLEELKNAIVKHLPQVFPEYRRYAYVSPHFKLIFKDMGIVIFYKPFLAPLKKFIKRLIGRK